jgi:predicted nuclease of restriction endonuclease-like (RecB) superfamily
MLKKSSKADPGDLSTPEEEIKDPSVPELLGLKDEYSESDLEEILILHRLPGGTQVMQLRQIPNC